MTAQVLDNADGGNLTTVNEIARKAFEMGQEQGRAYTRNEILTELRSRLQNGANVLSIDAGIATDPHEKIRLSGKADGMKVALSYIEEGLRTL